MDNSGEFDYGSAQSGYPSNEGYTDAAGGYPAQDGYPDTAGGYPDSTGDYPAQDGYAGFPESGGAPIDPTDPVYRARLLENLGGITKNRKSASPALVLLLLVFCFPAGLVVMYAKTRWGAYAKTFITIFTLLVVFAIYEILAIKGVIPAPSLIDTIIYIISQY